MKARKQTIILSLAVVLVAATLFGAYTLFKGPMQRGDKAVAVTVVGSAGETLMNKTLRTDATTLSALLEENKIVGFKQSSYGRYIITVYGLTADEGKQQWWHISQNGKDAMTGADELIIKDGDTIVLTLKSGY